MDVVCATFSIVGRDGAGDFGVAVATARPAVGALVPHVCLRGAIATQSFVNIELGLRGIEAVARGAPVDRALADLLAEDPRPELRQVHGLDAGGRVFAHTGDGCVVWAGHRQARDVSVAGNMLVGEETVAAMAAGFEATAGSGLELADRLLRALEAGQAAGGDQRGKQSAALLVASPAPRFHHNLRVDDHADPVRELRRIFDLVRADDAERRERYAEYRVTARSKW
ncbi:MAG: DUF1028 domain-containing protein [Candidatus Rokuibacteriota bacterium]